MKKFSVISIIVVMILILSSCQSMFLSSKKFVTNDVNDYPKCLSDYHAQSGLTLFPSTVPDNCNVLAFYFYGSHPALDDEIQLYLDCKFTKENYDSEVKRLSNAENAYDADAKGSAVYDNDNFYYPAYVIRLGSNCTNEYALLIENDYRIVYIFLQFVKKDDVKFDKSYLPKSYKEYGECSLSYIAGIK